MMKLNSKLKKYRLKCYRQFINIEISIWSAGKKNKM